MQLSPRTLGIVAAVLAGALVLWLWPKKQVNDEDQIRALVAACVRSVEERELSVLGEAMADDFKGPEGAGRDEVKRMIAFQALRNNEGTSVFNPTLTVTITDADTAELSGNFVFARGKSKALEAVPEGGVLSAYEITAKLEKRDGKWRFISATAHQRGG